MTPWHRTITRALMSTIVIFSLASLGASTSQSMLQLLVFTLPDRSGTALE